ncbi:MAG: nitrogenase [Pleurocapsa minor HA4230-MV1]|jgi:tellurite resistance protein|nr:nitrogenase [Pleurocapsa minor HA4230-MV1]
MTTIIESAYSDRQMVAWFRGLYTIALADGHYTPEEQELIGQLTQDLVDINAVNRLESITPEELATTLGKEPDTAENFLRTAVLVAVADGIYSTSEYELLHQFSDALEIEVEALKSLENNLYRPEVAVESDSSAALTPSKQCKLNVDVLHPVKDWLEGMEVKDPRLAKFICKIIPPQCPFERDINLFGRKVAHIPPLCKLNPLYEQFTMLRFRSLSYLADECGEDVTKYVQ